MMMRGVLQMSSHLSVEILLPTSVCRRRDLVREFCPRADRLDYGSYQDRRPSASSPGPLLSRWSRLPIGNSEHRSIHLDAVLFIVPIVTFCAVFTRPLDC